MQIQNTKLSNKSQQLVDQIENGKRLEAMDEIFQILWGHNITIVTKVKDIEVAKFYVKKTIEGNWSRATLRKQIETQLYIRKGKSVTNFKEKLPSIEEIEAEFEGKI
jgi:hypothetical protein